MSRPLLEGVIRRRLGAQPNVLLRAGCRALHLVPGDGGAAVTAVELAAPDGRGETLPADLVVDASGRGELTLALLKATGRPPLVETVIGVDFGYSSAIFEIEAPPPAWKICAHFPEVPRSSRMGILARIEDGRWIASLGGRYEEKPPGDEDGFLAFAASLRTPTIHQKIAGARRVSEISRFGFPASIWRRFEGGLPRGLLPIGDALCRFNPLYGQGMSVAVQQAALLRRVLAAGDGLDTVAAAFLAGAQPLIETPWAMAALPDLAYPRTEGERPSNLPERLRFGAALLRLAAEDPAVHKLTVEVQHLLRPRSAYADPALQQRVHASMMRPGA